MASITADSPLAAVFGNRHQKRKLVEEGLGITTVGELLHHFPRRYIPTTEVSEVAEPVGELAAVVDPLGSPDGSAPSDELHAVRRSSSTAPPAVARAARAHVRRTPQVTATSSRVPTTDTAKVTPGAPSHRATWASGLSAWLNASLAHGNPP